MWRAYIFDNDSFTFQQGYIGLTNWHCRSFLGRRYLFGVIRRSCTTLRSGAGQMRLTYRPFIRRLAKRSI